MSPSPDPNAPRILLVRLSAIGDVVFASPLVAALRRSHPRAHIAWLVQPECAPLLAQHPDLDEVIPCPINRWRRLVRERRLGTLARELRAMRAELRARRFDRAIDLQGLLKSGMLTWFSGAPERIGLGAREGSQWLMTRTVARDGPYKRIGSEYLHLARTLDLAVEPFAMAVHHGEAEHARVAELVAPAGAGARLVALSPFTTRPQKHWIESRWADLAERLHQELGLTPVLLGGPGDREAAARIVARCKTPLLDLTGATSLTEAAALIDRAALAVAVDTGLGHIGIAMNTPSLLLFGSTCPYLDTTRDNARVLYHPRPCSPCKRHPSCDGRFDCMREITVEAVVEAARELLADD
ncbi:lipopolysaccharide heptosyltransferase II [Marichromatium gracile]|uniref:lipopolysaccharide heptosyltransferase II n=1 Tax=Marichromatium gracile TaxID=1048 RepID=UPI001F43DFB9|nr:lipopolysaccharide heptosyltransferase II [Marichromatium gracile]MCF1184546.1 lipopolysaccharide heptosyltransferase II [Marichromatium gracile]